MTDSQPHVIRAFLLQPDVAGVIVGELDDQHPFVFRKRGRDLLDELLLPLDVHGREELVLVDGLQQLFVLLFALVLGIGERRYVAQLAVEIEFRAAGGKFDELFGRWHDVILPRALHANVTRTVAPLKGVPYERFC